MSGHQTLDSVTIDGVSLEVGEELYTRRQFAHIPTKTYLRIDELYEMQNGDVYASIQSYANGTGAEWDGAASVITNVIGSKLERREYDPTMHD